MQRARWRGSGSSRGSGGGRLGGGEGGAEQHERGSEHTQLQYLKITEGEGGGGGW